MWRQHIPIAGATAILLGLSASQALAQAEAVNTIKDAFVRLHGCWKPPPPSAANPIDITVVVSFNRAGEILGHPRISYELEQASDNDRLVYRVAVMEALQRCTPMPFTEGMAGAVAGRPLAIRFHGGKRSPKPVEKQAWLSPKIL